jgi:hypothetical protein
MASIYQNAVFTVSAAAALGGEGSFFSFTPDFHHTKSWDIIADYNRLTNDEELITSTHPLSEQSIRTDEEKSESLSSNSSSDLRRSFYSSDENAGSGENTDDWEDMNSEEDIDNGCWNTAIGAVNPRLHRLISSDFWMSSDSIGV